MRLLIQSVQSASIHIHDIPEIRAIGQGLVIYIGIDREDIDLYEKKIATIVTKLPTLRRLKDANHRLNATLSDTQGEILLVSNFTLYGEVDGTKMSFSKSAPAEQAQPIYDMLVQEIKKIGVKVQTGEFGALMDITSVNHGPINYVRDI